MLLLCSSLLFLLSPSEQSGLDNRTFGGQVLLLLGSRAAGEIPACSGKDGSARFCWRETFVSSSAPPLSGDYLFQGFIGPSDTPAHPWGTHEELLARPQMSSINNRAGFHSDTIKKHIHLFSVQQTFHVSDPVRAQQQQEGTDWTALSHSAEIWSVSVHDAAGRHLSVLFPRITHRWCNHPCSLLCSRHQSQRSIPPSAPAHCSLSVQLRL